MYKLSFTYLLHCLVYIRVIYMMYTSEPVPAPFAASCLDSMICKWLLASPSVLMSILGHELWGRASKSTRYLVLYAIMQTFLASRVHWRAHGTMCNENALPIDRTARRWFLHVPAYSSIRTVSSQFFFWKVAVWWRYNPVLFMASHRAGHYILQLWFLSFFFLSFSLPILSGWWTYLTAPKLLNRGQPNFARCLVVSWADTLTQPPIPCGGWADPNLVGVGTLGSRRHKNLVIGSYIARTPTKIHWNKCNTRNVGQCPTWWPPCRI